MKAILIKILKFILVVSLLLILGVVTFGGVIWMKWPWWIGFCFLLVYFGLYCLWVLFRKILLRRREKRFINEVIAQDDSARKGDDDPAALDLQAKWKEAIDTLNQSKLGKSGNPLYALPWYMVIGESGSGKTTAIQSARLSAPFAETRKTAGLSSTRNCDWWFFEQAVILDTAGRYTIPLEEGRDKKEWQKFLSLLVKYRKKEALNGLVVTIPADKLLRSSAEEISGDGQNIRQRIDELMRVVGIKIPVYVLVTKCDLIQGMTGFCDYLPEKCLSQAMGILNRDLSKDVSLLAERLVQSISDVLKKMRLVLFAAQTEPGLAKGKPNPDLLIFPNEFSSISGNLRSFVEMAFKENPYQETPILRGIYLSSGKQEGTPYSHLLNALGLIAHQEVLPGTSRGFFLHDLFATIMAGDRGMHAPTKRALAWNRLTRNFGLTAWAAIVLALCGLLSFSFMKNLTTLRTATEAFDQSIALHGDIITDTAVMERFQKAVSTVERTNDTWWFPRLGLYQSLESEERIKARYCDQFKKEYSADFDQQLLVGTSGLSASTPDDVLGDFIVHLTHRINMIQARLAGGGIAKLQDLAQPSYQPFISAADSQLVNQLSERIVNQYHHYLVWQTQRSQLEDEMKVLQKQLHHALTLEDSNLNWLVGWINRDERYEYLLLETFWGDQLSEGKDISVPPAFTSDGKAAVENLLGQIEKALPDPLVIAANKARFNKYYVMAYKQVWYDFARMFPRAEYYLKDRDAWQQTAALMAQESGPYFAVLKRMVEEIGELDGDQADEAWIQLLRQLDKVWQQAKSEKAIAENKSLLAKVSKKGKKAISTIEKGLGTTDIGQSMESQLLGGAHFNNYRTALTEVVLASSSRKVAFQMASDVFKQDPATSEAALYEAQRHLIKLRQELSAPGSGKETLVIWRLVAGPLTFLRDFTNIEAACSLNSLWEEDVLVEVQDIADKTRLNDKLFETGGLALQFVKGPASPFLGRNLEQGFYARGAMGKVLPLRQEFLSFLTSGIRMARHKPDLGLGGEMPLARKQAEATLQAPQLRDRYAVLIEASPTSVNKGAKMIPHAVSLELLCGADSTRLVNLQYPVRREFVWKPEGCQELSLKIEIGSLVLEKKYEGEHGFPRFVKDYQSGSVTYLPQDFPEKEKMLKRLNVRTISVKFKAKQGAEPLFNYLDRMKKYNEARGLDEFGNKIGGEQNIAEALMSIEQKRKAEELENEALKKAWKAKQAARAAEIKRRWEEQLPEVPHDIAFCWD